MKNWYNALEAVDGVLHVLPAEEVGRLVLALQEYAETGEAPVLEGIGEVLLAACVKAMERGEKRRVQISQARSKAGRKGGMQSMGKAIECEDESKGQSNQEESCISSEDKQTEQNQAKQQEQEIASKSSKTKQNEDLLEEREKEIFPPAPPIKEKDKESPEDDKKRPPTGPAFSGGLPDSGGFLTDEEAVALQAGIGEVLDEAEKCGFSRNERTFDRLNLLCAEFTAGWVMRALDQVAESAKGTPSIAFLRAILDRYRRQGGPDGTEAAAQEDGPSTGYLYEPDLKNPRIWESGDGP